MIQDDYVSARHKISGGRFRNLGDPDVQVLSLVLTERTDRPV
jgi:hypothetical protein